MDSDDARRTLVAFLRRADAILATAAAQRADLATVGPTIRVLLLRLTRSFWSVTGRIIDAASTSSGTGRWLRSICWSFSPTRKVVAAAGFLARDAPEEVRSVVAQARRALPRALRAERWTVMVAGPDGSSSRLSDVEIAELWFNANVWHDDEDKQWALRHISDDERLKCATVWVSDRVLAVRAVQQLVVDLRRAGHAAA